jgi:CBS domain-containing protein/anti-sigma regulatory factor (Ser/Thr protein kinase)
MQITKTQELAYELKVSDAMKKDIISVSPKILIKELREIFRRHRISGVPVVEDNKLVGIISLEDFIKCLADGEINVPVEEKMTKEVETIYSDEQLICVMNKFEQFGFGRFPVIERENKNLVGIITKGDVISTLLKKLESDYMEKEIKRLRINHILKDISADSTTLILKYKIKGKDFKHAGEISSRLKKSLLNLGISPLVVRSVTIATYEAEMNIVIFAEEGEITIYAEPKKIKVEAIDKGPGIPDIEQALKPGFSTAPDWVRELGFGAGMGLPNIKKCTDYFKIQSKLGEGTKLEFVVNINWGEKNEG